MGGDDHPLRSQPRARRRHHRRLDGARRDFGSFGLGTKWYLGKWFAFRIDLRDHILQEALVGEEHLVNDILLTGGFSVFIPFSG